MGLIGDVGFDKFEELFPPADAGALAPDDVSVEFVLFLCVDVGGLARLPEEVG
jgi:hypothetical protein